MRLRGALTASFASVLFCTSVASAQTLTFARDDSASYPGARAIATADFDRNGWPDVAQANTGRNSVTILLNHRDTGLTRAFDIAVGAGPFDLTTGDYNRDAIPDLAVANADGNSISLLMGRGDGSFTRSDIATPTANPRAIVTTDVNKDAKPDLVYSGYAIRTVQVLLGDGAGGFTKGATYVGSPVNPQGLAAADFNHDGRLEIALAYASAGGLRILYADGPLYSGRTIAGDRDLNVLAAGDFNRDGWQDVAAASTSNSTVGIYLGSATGLAHTQTYATGASPRGITAEDVNRDGLLDIVTANRGSSTVSVLIGDCANPGTFLARIDVGAGAGSRGVVAADFNADGRLDLATGNEYAGSVTVLSNEMLLKPAAYTFRNAASLPTTIDVAGDISAADFNRDGTPDFVMRAMADGYLGVAVVLTGGPTRFLRTIDPDAGVFTGDVNADGRLDVIAHHESSAIIREGTGLHTQWVTYLGDGAGGFVPSALTESSLWLRECQPADMNRDGRLDLVCIGIDTTTNSPVLQLMTGRGDGTFRPGAAPAVSAPYTSHVQIVDLNRDGSLDALVVAADVEIWLGDGAGGLSRHDTVDTGAIEYPVCLRAADLNHDGRLDLAFSGSDDVGIALGTANGFADVALASGSLGRFVIADADNDSNPDLLGNSGVMLFGTGDGTFSPPTAFAFGAASPVDFNGDGLLDFVHAAWQELRVVLNERNDVNHPPVVSAPDRVFDPQQVVWDCARLSAQAVDPDRHALTLEWRDAAGTIISRHASFEWCANVYGTYEYTLTVADGRGAMVTKTVSLSFVPSKEIVLHVMQEEGYWLTGNWMRVADATAASGYRAYDSGLGGAKVTVPSANPANAVRIQFVPDPTQTYKLWVRLKADNNSWANDSVWMQFSGSTDTAGTPKYRIGTTSGLPVSLEECSNCGVSGWGWEDDGWGAPNRNGVLLRFPEGGVQYILVQTREDGVSIDQVVLSAEKYLTTRPGAPKNDATILARTFSASPY